MLKVLAHSQGHALHMLQTCGARQEEQKQEAQGG